MRRTRFLLHVGIVVGGVGVANERAGGMQYCSAVLRFVATGTRKRDVQRHFGEGNCSGQGPAILGTAADIM